MVSGGEEVAAAKSFRSEADDAGYFVHVTLKREQRLGRAEAAKGSVGRGIGGHGPGADGDVRPEVRAGSMDGGAREDDRRKRGVGATIEGDVDLAGEDFSVAGDGGAMARAAGVALGGRDEVFRAVVTDLYRVPRFHRE